MKPVHHITRKPRPRGATFLSLKYQDTGNEEDKEMLLRHLISIYTTSGFRWNDIPTSIPQLSEILQIPQHVIMGHVSNVGSDMAGLADPQNLKNTLQTIATLATTFSLEDRGLIMQQLSLLQESQQGTYKPFITAEVNKVLKLALDSNKNITDLLKTFTSSSNSTTNILNVYQEQNDNEEEDKEYLTPDQAFEILNINNKPKSLSEHKPDNDDSLPADMPKSQLLADTSSLADELHDRYGIGDLVDVRERRSGTEALQAPDMALTPNSPPAERPSLPAEDAHSEHFKRRGLDTVDEDELPTS